MTLNGWAQIAVFSLLILALTKPRVMSLVVFSGLCGLLAAPQLPPLALGFTAILCIALGAGACGALNQWYEAEIDATDQLEFPDQNANAVEVGIHPQLAALEAIVYPTSDQLQSNNALAKSGTLEIIPMESALTLFIWSKNRIIPVRLTDFSITEEAFDSNLNPIRAKVSLGMRVLSVNDVGFDAKAGSLYMTYQQQKERLASLAPAGSFANLGIKGIS